MERGGERQRLPLLHVRPIWNVGGTRRRGGGGQEEPPDQSAGLGAHTGGMLNAGL